MDLRAEILKEHSKTQCTKIAGWVNNSQARFDMLFNLFLHDEYRVKQRASWCVCHIVLKNPNLIVNKVELLMNNLEGNQNHSAVIRNTLRILEKFTISKKHHGKLIDFCLNYISNDNETIAIRAYAINILKNLCELYPEIMNEVKLILETQKIESSALNNKIRKLNF